MSNKIALNMAYMRAKKLEQERQTFTQDITIEVPTQTILFAAGQVAVLEEQLRQLQWELAKRDASLAEAKAEAVGLAELNSELLTKLESKK